MGARLDRGRQFLLLGVDGGGSKCRARLTEVAGKVLGKGIAGPANIRLGLQESLSAVHDAAGQCLQQAGLSEHASKRIVACLALAGACESATEARASPLAFYRATFTS